jgi:bifunctional non-homologous end joining protein LigD
MKMPKLLKPMLATLVDEPFDDEGWLYEIKWDGYRALVYLDNGDVEMKSRNNKSFNERFYSLYNALKKWKVNAIVDGEIVVVNEDGIPDFSALQNWRSEADGELLLYIFDLLWYEGKDLTQQPVTERKDLLKRIMPKINNIRMSESFNAGASEFFKVAKKLNLEGIMAKKTDSKYYPGERTKEWLKIKTGKSQEVIIGGFTRNKGSKKEFSSLLVGLPENGTLKYTGKIGTGFSNKLQKELMEKFEPLETKECPFTNKPDVNKPSRFRPSPPQATATWIRPVLTCEVSYAELTSDGVMRHPSFKGMREDKNPDEIVKEKPKATAKIIAKPAETENSNKKMQTKKVKPQQPKGKELALRLLHGAADTSRKTLLNPTEKSQTKKINGKSITFNNLNKIYFPKDKVTKRDVINYYYLVAPFILPYMKDRPQTLIRYPNGIAGKSFYQKDVTGKVPDWVKKFPYSSEHGGRRNFMVCTNEASLLLIASLGGLEMHPWSSRSQKPDNPDWCIIDLDPSSKNTFDQVITAAQTTKKILDAIDVPCYCKTSGATGLHIYIPLGAKYNYEQSKEFARMVVTIVRKEIPSFTSIERIIENRENKLYLDFLQNRPQATLAAPYSLRPKTDATVSMPLHWDEVTKGLKVKDFTIFNAVDRLQKQGDIFSPVLGKGINLKKVVTQIQKNFDVGQVHKSLLM